jgi:hypothetical protein
MNILTMIIAYLLYALSVGDVALSMYIRSYITSVIMVDAIKRF